MADLIGQTLAGRYRIESHLGTGGMGIIYRAVDTDQATPVAIKVMHDQFVNHEHFRSRFLQEAELVSSFDHPGIVRVLYHTPRSSSASTLYIVMELIEGGSLRDYLNRLPRSRRYVSADEAIHIIRHVARALQYAHERSMVHRDVKPENILLRPRQETGDLTGYQALLTDFGLAKLISSLDESISERPIGTFPYMSPEQCQGGEIDSRTDIYALGIVLYELMVGDLPFRPQSIWEAYRLHAEAPVPPPRTVRADFPASMEHVILRCLAKHPAERYQSAGELIAVLGQYALNPETSMNFAGTMMRGSMPDLEALRETGMRPETGQEAGNHATDAGQSSGIDSLIVLRNDQPVRVITLDQSVMTIGRAAGHHISLDDQHVSRNHARLERQPDGSYWVKDSGATNPAMLGDVPLTIDRPEQWHYGEKLYIGDTVLQLVAGVLDTLSAAIPGVQADSGIEQPESSASPPQAHHATQPGPAPPPVQSQAEPDVSAAPESPEEPDVSAAEEHQATQPEPDPPVPQPEAVASPRQIIEQAVPDDVDAEYQATQPEPADGTMEMGRASPGRLQPLTVRDPLQAELDPVNIRIVPGETVEIQVSMHNQGNREERLALDVRGVPGRWSTLRDDVLSLPVGERLSTSFQITPPRSALSRAGRHTYTVRLRSLVHQMELVRLTGTVHLESFTAFTAELYPKRLQNRGTLRLTISSQGNAPCDFMIRFNDRQGGLGFSILRNRFTIEAGEQETVEIEVYPHPDALVHGAKHFPFDVTVISAAGEEQTLRGDVIAVANLMQEPIEYDLLPAGDYPFSAGSPVTAGPETAAEAERERDGCLTAWLGLYTAAIAALALMLMIPLALLTSGESRTVSGVVLPVVLAGAGFVFLMLYSLIVYQVWRWRRWALYVLMSLSFFLLPIGPLLTFIWWRLTRDKLDSFV